MNPMTLTTAEIETALRNSGYDFNSKITDAEWVDNTDTHPQAAVYEIFWDVGNHLEPVTFCTTVYITEDETGKLFGDI